MWEMCLLKNRHKTKTFPVRDWRWSCIRVRVANLVLEPKYTGKVTYLIWLRNALDLTGKDEMNLCHYLGWPAATVTRPWTSGRKDAEMEILFIQCVIKLKMQNYKNKFVPLKGRGFKYQFLWQMIWWLYWGSRIILSCKCRILLASTGMLLFLIHRFLVWIP